MQAAVLLLLFVMASADEATLMHMHDWIIESVKHKHIECDTPVADGDWIAAHYSLKIASDSPVGEPNAEIFNSWRSRRKLPLDFKVLLMEDGELSEAHQLQHLVNHQFIGLCPGEQQETRILVQELHDKEQIDERDPRALEGAHIVIEQEIFSIRDPDYAPAKVSEFDRLDLNADQVIDRKEFIYCLSKTMPPATTAEQHSDMQKDLVKLWSWTFASYMTQTSSMLTFDDILDGENRIEVSDRLMHLTEEDRPTPERYFSEMDVDGDGKFSRQEQVDWYHRTRDVDPPEGYFDGDDHNGDGFVTMEEFQTVQPTKHHDFVALHNELLRDEL